MVRCIATRLAQISEVWMKNQIADLEIRMNSISWTVSVYIVKVEK
jgi:hypothetical protein